MIVGPTANLGGELIDQIGGRHSMCSFDGSSDTFQEGFNILLGGLDEQFPVRISAHVLSEEIKAALHVRNDGLLRREFKTPFLQAHQQLALSSSAFPPEPINQVFSGEAPYREVCPLSRPVMLSMWL